MDNKEKLESLSKMMDEMERENEEKFKKGDQQAGQRLADLAYFRKQMNQSCQHVWEYDNGRYYCAKCGEDGGSAWDC